MYSKIKQQYTLITACLASVVLMSCGKGFLEKEQVGRISKEVLYSDLPGLRSGLNGAYNRMADYYVKEFTMYGDVAGDLVSDSSLFTSSGTANPPMLQEYNFTSNAGDDEYATGHIWAYGFVALDHANSVLDAVSDLRDKYPSAATELNQITAQALIMRALCHFDLCKVYAQTYQYTTDASHLGVPVLLKTPNPGTLVPRQTVKEVYAHVIADLKAGEELLRKNPMAKDQYAASYQAAWALLSRVYLYMGQWDQSIAYADSVINKGGYTLTPAASYESMYTSGTPGAEVIWQLYNRSYKASTVAGVYAYQFFASNKLLSLYDAGDIRKQLYRDSTGRKLTLKYGVKGFPISATKTPMDPKVVRLSEVYLNRAEALWNKKNYTQAIEDLHAVADRAHNNTAVTIPSDPTQLFQFISDERSRELCFEGHRLYDITRRKQDLVRGSGCTSTTCTLTYPNVRFVLPIPQKELDANKAMQPNPGIN